MYHWSILKPGPLYDTLPAIVFWSDLEFWNCVHCDQCPFAPFQPWGLSRDLESEPLLIILPLMPLWCQFYMGVLIPVCVTPSVGQLNCNADPTKPWQPSGQLWSKHCQSELSPVGRKCPAFYLCSAQSRCGLAQAGCDFREGSSVKLRPTLWSWQLPSECFLEMGVGGARKGMRKGAVKRNRYATW